MKKQIQVIITALALLATGGLIGCAPRGNMAVPSSHIVGNLNSGTFDLLLPKDQSIGKLTIDRDGSNITVKLEDLKSANNPDVIAPSYAGQIAMMRAQLDALVQMFQAGLSAAATGAKFAQPIVK